MTPAERDRLDQLERDVDELRQRLHRLDRVDENLADVEDRLQVLNDWLADLVAGAA